MASCKTSGARRVRHASQADGENGPWRSEPLARGEWREVKTRDAAHLVEQLPKAVFDSAPFPMPTFRARMRALLIACLPGWSLVEAEICTGLGHHAVLRLLADASNVLPLDGSANPFQIAARQDFDASRLADQRAARQYLRVYVGSVHAGGGAFGIHEPSATNEDRGIAVRPGRNGCAICLTRVQHEDQLFAARFVISTAGDVTILKDCFLGTRAVSRKRLLWGPWQINGLN